MAQAIVSGNIGLLRNGQDASGRRDAVVADNHGTVVQRAVFEEDILNQRMGYVGVDGDTCRNDIIQIVVAREQDERSLLDIRHVEAGLGDRVDVQVHITPDAQKLEPLGQLALLGLRSDGEEETPYLRLENDDERNETHTDKGTKDGGQHFHLQGLDQLPDEENGHDADEDAHGGGAFQEAVKAIEKARHQKDVENVENADLYEQVDHDSNFAGKITKSPHQFDGLACIFHIVDAQDVGAVEQCEGVEHRCTVLGSIGCGVQHLVY